MLALNEKAPPKGLEMSIITQAALADMQHPMPFEFHFSNEWIDKFRSGEIDLTHNRKDGDLAGHLTIIKARGVVLYGLAVDELFPDVPEQYYYDSIAADASNILADITSNPVYNVLNLCRVWAYKVNKLITSKEEGGKWALRHASSTQKQTIGQALAEYTNNENTAWDDEELQKFGKKMTAILNLGVVDERIISLANMLATQHLNSPLKNISSVIGSGEVNDIYLLETATKKAVLRVNGLAEFERFKKEQWCIERSIAKGVPGAAVYDVNKDDNFANMLLDFIKGDNGSSIKSTLQLWETLGKHLRQIHQIPVKGFGESLTNIINGNLKQWEAHLTYNIESLNESDKLIQIGVLNSSSSAKLKSIFQNLAGKDFAFGLNHGDFSLANVIVDEQSTAHVIDWGSAQAHVVPHHDLGVILDESLDQNSDEFNALLAGYGLTRVEFDDIKQDIIALQLLEATDKLRWALDKSPQSVDDCTEHLMKFLKGQ